MTHFRSGIVATAAVAALVIIGLLLGVTASATAGPGGSATVAAKKKCGKKKGKKGVAAAKKKGCGKKKPAPPAPPVVPPAALNITPATFVFPDPQHGCNVSCPTQAFTVTNTGASTSGIPAATITEVTQPVIGAHTAGYSITTSTCTAALAPAATCSLTVKFNPSSNTGDGNYTSTLNVTAPGSTAGQASLSGHAD